MSETLFSRMGGRPALTKLLHHFYADVRQHQVLGPIFAAHITDWPSHLEKIADFWSTIAGGPPSYSGPMAAKHIPLGLKEEHFKAWLGLWEHNCKIWLPIECAEEMMHFARSIVLRLRTVTGVTCPVGRPDSAIFSERQYRQSGVIRLQSALKT